MRTPTDTDIWSHIKERLRYLTECCTVKPTILQDPPMDTEITIIFLVPQCINVELKITKIGQKP